jgi:mannobiose 2-epimerase
MEHAAHRPTRTLATEHRRRPPAAALLLAAAATLAGGCVGVAPRSTPALPADFAPAAVRQALVEHLDRQVLPTWTAPELVDTRYGGFFNVLDAAGHPVGQDFKPLIAHLRLLYVHAVASQRCQDAAERDRLRRCIDDGLAFLETRFWDAKEPGWVYELTSEGFVGNGQKRMVCQVYAIYVLAELHRLLGNARALALAEKTFDLIDAEGWDAANGGYGNDHTKPAGDEANAYRDVGTQFHAMLALASLYGTAPKPAVRARLETLYRLTTTRFVYAATGHGHLRLTPDWQPLPDEKADEAATLYGHNAEMIWYSLAAAEALGRDPAELRPWAERAAAAFMRDAMTRDGAVFLLGHLDGPATDERVAWWGQAEAMILFLRLWQLTGDPQYYRRFEAVTRWSFAHLVDPRTGLWAAVADEYGRKVPAHPGGTCWMAGLHVTRMLLEAERILAAPPPVAPAQRRP